MSGLPGTGRPTTLPGNVNPPGGGDRPGRPTTLPGNINTPGGGDRPGRPTTLPDNITGPGGRPGQGGAGGRPALPGGGDSGGGGRFDKKPDWVNIDNSTNVNIGNNIKNKVGNSSDWGNQNYWNNHPDRGEHWNNWGDGVRDHFDRDWDVDFDFDDIDIDIDIDHGHGWHYWYDDDYYHHHHHNWWIGPTWAATTGFLAGWVVASAWRQPVVYDYGHGGNVTYENNTIYMAGEEVAPASEYAQNAATLATVEAPPSEEEAVEMEWMALGRFALTTDPEDLAPSRIVELAVAKNGVVAGTLSESKSEKTLLIQGRVDKETQRVAMRIEGNDTVVVETGIYNLTQDQAPLMVFFGGDRVENYMLVRLPDPDAP